MAMCKCHPDETFCPDMVCVDFDDDAPVFARRDSPEGQAAIARSDELLRKIDREEFDRLKAKYGWLGPTEAEKLRSEVVQLRAAQSWQSIETAPKDGTYVWVSNGFSMRIAFWADGKEFEHQGSIGGGWRDLALAERGGAADMMFAPTHWQALPKPPHHSVEQKAP